MPEFDPSSVAQTSSALVFALIALAFGFQKLLKAWKETNTETDLITRLHTELERMSDQNTKLALELNKLQQEILTLNKQIRDLSEENHKLHYEVCALNAQVYRLSEGATGKKGNLCNPDSC